MDATNAGGDPGLELPDRHNRHCLDQLIQAAGTRELVVSEDIRDQRGMLLVARGQRVSAGLRERLIARRLLRPLESSLEYCDELRPSEVQLAAQRELDEHPGLARMLGDEVRQVLGVLARARTLSAPGTLLTTLGQTRPAAFSHAVRVAMIAAWLAASLSRSDGAMREAAEVGLLHDLGEMYFDPALLDIPEARQDFAQWRMCCVHPVIGAALLGESGVYSPQQAVAVREHHERVDGSGYPVGYRALSPLGRLLSSAEVLDTLLERERDERPLARIRIAMRMVPGQFPREVVDLVSGRLKQRETGVVPAHDPQRLCALVTAIIGGLERARDEVVHLQHATAMGRDERDLLQHMRLLIVRYTMALHESGVRTITEHPAWLADAPEAAEEVYRIGREMGWQLPGLRRHAELLVHLRVRAKAAWQPLLDALAIELPDPGPGAGPAIAGPAATGPGEPERAELAADRGAALSLGA